MRGKDDNGNTNKDENTFSFLDLHLRHLSVPVNGVWHLVTWKGPDISPEKDSSEKDSSEKDSSEDISSEEECAPEAEGEERPKRRRE